MKIVVALVIGALIVLSNTPKGALAREGSELRDRVVEQKMDKKDRSCRARESVVKKKMENVFRTSKKTLSKFEQITQRVEDYYLTKLVPEGVKVENYERLVADVEVKKKIVVSDLEKAKAFMNEFNCDKNNPEGQVAQFKQHMQNVHKSLQNYRKSIKDLMSAVKLKDDLRP